MAQVVHVQKAVQIAQMALQTCNSTNATLSDDLKPQQQDTHRVWSPERPENAPGDMEFTPSNCLLRQVFVFVTW